MQVKSTKFNKNAQNQQIEAIIADMKTALKRKDELKLHDLHQIKPQKKQKRGERENIRSAAEVLSCSRAERLEDLRESAEEVAAKSEEASHLGLTKEENLKLR